VLEQAAIDHGLDPPTARLLTLETAFGAAKMALEGDAEPAELRRRVTSPGGTTERAIQVLQEGNVALLFSGAIEVATARSRELGDLLGEK
jgi:pyrroline-5-carboxylate reductase